MAQVTSVNISVEPLRRYYLAPMFGAAVTPASAILSVAEIISCMPLNFILDIIGRIIPSLQHEGKPLR